MEIAIEPKERKQGNMSQAKAERAAQAIGTDGYVVLDNVVDHEVLDTLRERMDLDSQKLIDAQKWGGAGQVFGQLQQGPPPFAPYVFADIVANPLIIQVTRTLLGDGVFNNLYNGNTNSPGSLMQPIHRDGGHLWPGLEIAHPPASVVVNISPMETTAENGAVEIWPGTHLVTDPYTDIEPADEEARRQIVPPIHASAKKGSVLIRDTRLWHRGVPNHADRPRHMIAMIHNIGWLRRMRKPEFQTGCEAAFEGVEFDHNVTFVRESIGDSYFLEPKLG